MPTTPTTATAPTRPHARPFSQQGRAEVLEQGLTQPYDLCVIGGGITGAGVARDAAMRGLRVLLVEQRDLASGTSSKSSKLLHGGIRYLEQYEFKLVWEACHERAELRRLAPHLAVPMPFLFPIFDGYPVGPFKLNLGLWLYDAMAGLQNIGLHRNLGVRGMREHEPGLRAEGLRGGALYYDAVTDDARLTLENARDAWERGADILTGVEVVELVREGGSVQGLRLVDLLAPDAPPREVMARCVIAAAGPWGDRIRRQAGVDQPLLRPTKGVHIIVPASRLPVKQAVVMQDPANHRILFVVPWFGLVLVGTTDTDYSGDPALAQADRKDIDYILGILRIYFPKAGLGLDDVVSTWTGLRPLIDDKSSTESQVSREHRIREDAPGLVTVAGGKLTTYRVMAAEAVDKAIEVLRRNGGTQAPDRSPSGDAVIVGGPPAGPAEVPGIGDAGLAARLHQLYGARAAEVARTIAATPGGAERLTALGDDVFGQVVYAFSHEMALHLDDALSRRTHALYAGISLAQAEGVTQRLAPLLGWDEARVASELAGFARMHAITHGWRDEPAP